MLGKKLENDTTAPADISEIRVTGHTGSVAVRPNTAARVDIHRTVHYFRPFQDPPGATHRVEGGVLHLDTNVGTSFPFFVAVDYVVDVPAGVRVSGSLSSGRISLTGVSTVDVETSSGSITLDGVTGDIAAKSSSGSITGRDLHSASIKATTTSGGLSLDLAEPANVTAQVSSGALKLTVPDDHYRIDTKASSGRTQVEVPNDEAGPYHLDLRSSSGAISVTRR